MKVPDTLFEKEVLIQVNTCKKRVNVVFKLKYNLNLLTTEKRTAWNPMRIVILKLLSESRKKKYILLLFCLE